MSEVWHGLRAKNIGGSDIASLFDCGYSTYYKLWHEKRGNIERDNLDGIDRIQAGNFMERGALEWANHKWGFDFYQPEIYIEHNTVKGMACTPDALCHKDDDIMGQVKNVDSLQFAREWEHDGEIITKAPLHILLQVQHEMECAKIDLNYLIVLVGGNRLFKMPCVYDSEIAEILRNKVIEFWAREEPPEPQFNKDGASIKKFKINLPAIEFADMSKDKTFHKLAKEFKQLKYEIATRADKLECVEAEIYHLSTDAQYIKCKDIEVKFSKRKGKPDKKITADDIGKTIKGRKESISIKIIDKEILL